VDDYHKKYPLRRGISREELKSRLKLPTRLYNAVLRRITSAGELQENETYLQRAGYTINFNAQQQHSVDGLLSRFTKDPFSPQTVKECIA
jgi:selenocysteine-specific elongation factor